MSAVSSTPLIDPALDPGLPKKLFDYDVIDLIGQGAGSLIYVVSQPGTNQLLALKHVVRKTEKDDRFIEQLENEYQVGKELTHPGLRRSIEFKANRTLLRRVTDAALVLERRVLRHLGAGQEQPALHEHELRRHVQELTGDVDVELAQSLQRGEVALGDAGDGDVEEVELVLLDEVQEQVERSLEGRLARLRRGERDLEGVERRAVGRRRRCRRLLGFSPLL